MRRKRISAKKKSRSYSHAQRRLAARRTFWSPLTKVFVALVFFALLAAGYFFLTDYKNPTVFTEEKDFPAPPPDFDREINKILDDFGIKTEWIIEEVSKKQKHIRIPKDFPVTLLFLEIRDAVKKVGGVILNAEEDMANRSFIIAVGYQGSVVERLVLAIDESLKREGGKIALIIDDFGYHDDSVAREFLEFDHKLTISIIPGLEESKKIAQKGKEIMIHLPMESLESKVEADGFTVFTTMSEEEIAAVIEKALAEIPQAQGIDNHMGSKATLDKRVMKSVMHCLKERNLYFVDSVTNPESIAFDTAKEMEVPCERNETFIDNPKSPQTIEQKLQLLAQKAQREGRAVGIGHAQRKTLEVLKKEIPRLEKKGFRFVYVSEIVR